MKKLTILILGLLLIGFLAKPQVNLQDGLVAYYPFNGNANDESGNGNNGTVNEATLNTDRFGNVNSAYSFDGNSHIQGLNGGINFPHGNSPFTIIAWVKSSGTGYANQGIFHFGTNSCCCQNYNLFYGLNGTKINAALGIGQTASDLVKDAEGVSFDNWHFFTGVFDGSKMKVYVDGIFKNELLISCTSNIGDVDLWEIGALMGRSDYNYTGKLDDIRLYNIGLTNSEISHLYANYQPPLIVIGTPSQLGQNRISWSAENISSKTKYRIYRDNVLYDSIMVSSPYVDDTLYIDNNVTIGASYQYFVTSFDNFGYESIHSDTVEVASLSYFTEIDAGLKSFSLGQLEWGDYNNDGLLDIIITGINEGNSASIVYENEGNNTFSEQQGIAIVPIYGSSVDWGDYNNDGFLDIAVSGWTASGDISKIYKNNGDQTFTEQMSISLPGVHGRSFEWGDCDNDGDLDLFLTGMINNTWTYLSKIYINNGNNSFTELVGTPFAGVSQGFSKWGDMDNDGDLDIISTGYNGGIISKFYRNDGGNTFTELTGVNLTPVQASSIDLGDLDNDGDLDIIIAGCTNNDCTSRVTKIYSNMGNNNFIDLGVSIPAVGSNCIVKCGDYNNDGLLDIFLSGDLSAGGTNISRIYKNNGDNTFSEQSDVFLPGVIFGSMQWGDYDLDGDLDILYCGAISGTQYTTSLFSNNATTPNSAPATPTNLTSTPYGSEVTLNWNAATDNETPSIALTYNVRVGKTPGGFDIVSPHSLSDGILKKPTMGNAQLGTSFLLKNLPAGTYYWSVQSVDNGYKGGAWATEMSFTIDGLVAYYPFNGNANDESGNGNNGTVNGATLSTDRFGNANKSYSFDGVNNYISIPYFSNLNITNDLTVETWINPFRVDINDQFIVSRCNPSIGNGWSLELKNSSLKLQARIGGVWDLPIQTPQGAIMASIWQHIAMTYNGSKVKIYINGALNTTYDVSGTISSDNSDLFFGRAQNAGWYYNGDIDDLHIYNRALNDQEIQALYNEQLPTVTDIDGNIYQTVTIGTQTWMKENLKTTKYNDGSDIPLVTDNAAWTIAGAAYCWYNNDAATYKATYGALYNWFSVDVASNGNKNVCPSGWHVPTDDEWAILTTYLGGESVAGGKMKEIGTTHWTTPNTGATNESGFTALPSGYRNYTNGLFFELGGDSYYWSSTQKDASIACNRHLFYGFASCTSSGNYNKQDGFAVRCIKNATKITIPDGSYRVDETFEISIETTSLASGDGIISYQCNFDYDQTKLQYADKSLTGTIADGGSVVVNSSTAGHLQISYMTSTPLSGAGNILKLQFNTLAEGTSSLTISNFLYNTTAVTSITNGTITINENIPPTAAITYSDTDGFVGASKNITIIATFSEPMADAPIPQIALSGVNTLAVTNMTKVSNTVYTFNHTVASGRGTVNVSLATGTDLVGNVVVATPTSGASFEVVRFGDVDDNTLIQAYDAALTLQYSVGLDPLPTADPLPWEAWRIVTANVDGVGSITAYDASLILQYSAGIITSFPAGSKKSGNENAEIKITIDKRFVQFRSKGELFGLNISVPKDFSNLGQPQILNSDMMSAFNINQTTYAVGLATAYPPKSGDVFMRIPIIGSTGSDITFDMIVNTVNVTVTVNLATGILEINESSLSMFPNPVTNELTINSISKNATISIYDLTGKLLISKIAKSETEKIDVSGLAIGAYTVKITDNKVTKTGKLIKQ
ncbi:MAG: T9SS type A sorting domain-containing protein [Bacteroidales bacterium]|nr:T9SS type A sorting domain-containing protein [Bacteroidales bacterium]